MTASVTSPEDLVNVALVRIGYTPLIANIYEGTKAARAALRVYAQTRDELLRANDWDFAERAVSLTLLKQAPVGGYFPPVVWNPTQYPALPWFYSYAYPSDTLKVRSVKPTPYLIPNFDPQYSTFSIDNDNTFTPGMKVILCNVAQAILVYTGQITDLTVWENDALEAFAAALGRRIGPAIVGLDVIKAEIPDEAQAAAAAEMEVG